MGIFDKFASFLVNPPEDCPPDLGRNEPCWCGSGKKYKKCHFEEDEKKRSRQRSACCKTS